MADTLKGSAGNALSGRNVSPTWPQMMVLALLAGVTQLGVFDRGIIPLDEGQLLTIGARIARGDVLYRDIDTGITPGIYYLTAALLATFGQDVLVTRIAQVVVNVLTVLLLYRLALRVVASSWALVPAAAYVAAVVLGFPILTFFSYSSLAMLFALAAMLVLLRYGDTGRRRDGVLLGVLLGAACVTKQNYGLLCAVAALAGLAIRYRADGPPPGTTLLRHLVPPAAGVFGVAAVVLLSFAAAGALPDLIEGTVLSIFRSQLDAFDQPIPPIFGPHPEADGRFIFLYLPSVLFDYLVRGETLFGVGMTPGVRAAAIRLGYGGTLLTLAAAPAILLLRSPGEPRRRADAWVLVVFALLMFLGIFPSAIWSHLLAVSPPVLIAAGIIADRIDRVGRTAWPRVGLVWPSLWMAGFVAVAILGVRVTSDVRRWNATPAGVPRTSVYVTPERATLLREAVAYIEACAAPTEPIYVAPDMPLLYFASGRPNPTPYDMTIPGNVTGRAVVARLEAARTRCIIYGPRMYVQFKAFEELFPELVAYLEAAYRRERVIRAGTTSWYALARREE